MSAPLDRTARIIAMFDSYCKTVSRNASRNLKRAKASETKYEAVAPMQYIFDLLSHMDTYPSDQFVLYADKFSCVVYSETLYKALQSLPDRERAVLLLDFWHGWTDEEISEHLEVTTRTVYNLRQRAFITIRNFYEQKGQEP